MLQIVHEMKIKRHEKKKTNTYRIATFMKKKNIDSTHKAVPRETFTREFTCSCTYTYNSRYDMNYICIYLYSFRYELYMYIQI